MERHAVEIELKFLIEGGLPDLSNVPSAYVRQGYILVSDGGEVRVRDAGGRFTLTAKAGRGLERDEHEIDLTRGQFEVLWPTTLGRRLEKRRYDISAGELVYELDVYAGALEGLATVEVEFDAPEQAVAFVPPAWFGRDVTGVSGYTNAELALGRRQDIEDPAR